MCFLVFSGSRAGALAGCGAEPREENFARFQPHFGPNFDVQYDLNPYYLLDTLLRKQGIGQVVMGDKQRRCNIYQVQVSTIMHIHVP